MFYTPSPALFPIYCNLPNSNLINSDVVNSSVSPAVLWSHECDKLAGKCTFHLKCAVYFGNSTWERMLPAFVKSLIHCQLLHWIPKMDCSTADNRHSSLEKTTSWIMSQLRLRVVMLCYFEVWGKTKIYPNLLKLFPNYCGPFFRTWCIKEHVTEYVCHSLPNERAETPDPYIYSESGSTGMTISEKMYLQLH